MCAPMQSQKQSQKHTHARMYVHIYECVQMHHRYYRHYYQHHDGKLETHIISIKTIVHKILMNITDTIKSKAYRMHK